ncbi:MAG TPA: carbohydrate ABC transporter permease [Bacilli bacterium]
MFKKLKGFFNKNKIRHFFLGMHFNDGFLYKAVIYLLLIAFSYIYLYPLFFMIVNSLKNIDDLIDPGVNWVPKTLYFDNYKRAFTVLALPKAFFTSSWYVIKVSVLTTFTSALVGYGFARFRFPLKKLFFILMLVTFILPPQVTMVSVILIFRKLGMMSSEATILLPAFLGQGFNSAIYILIFYQFFRTIPRVLDESAQLDGAGPFRVFRSISLPLARPAIIIVFLFSFVWTWNETFVTGLYAGGQITLPLKLQAFAESYATIFPPGTPGAELNEAIKLAGNVLTVLPLLVIYFIFQKWFTESIDRTGITGE